MTTAFRQVLTDQTMEHLNASLGMSLFHFHNKSAASVYCTLDEQSVATYAIREGVSMTLRDENQYEIWNIGSVPLGDIVAGYDMYGLNIYREHHGLTNDEWFEMEFPGGKSKNGDFTFRINGQLTGVDIYGYYPEPGRKFEDVEAEVALDMLLVLNTDLGTKIAITGNGRDEKVFLSVYAQHNMHQFDEWVNSRENHLGDKLFCLSRQLRAGE